MSDLARTASSSTVRDVFQRAFRIYGPRIAVTAEEGQWTYTEIGEQARQLAAALHGLGLRQGDRVAVLSETELLAAAGDSAPPAADIQASDIHNVLYTSGTTGRPKGAMISHGAAAIRGLRLAQWFGLTPDDGFAGWLPLFHCGGDESLYATMLTGGTFGALRKADVETMFRMTERDRLSWTLLLPGVIADFLHHPRRQDYDLTNFRFAIGYASMMPSVIQQLTGACGIDFYDAFGQTETSYLLAHGVSGPGEAPSLRKLPSPLLDVRIVADDLTELPVGQPGECVVRGPSVMSGYLDDPAATEEAFRGGWLHTGDLLTRHEDGTLSFVDRKKYLIKTGGENVYPAEAEQVIAAHPAVQEVCVFGVPDERWGETVKAAVVLHPDGELDAAGLDAWCRDRLAGYKRPRYLAFLAPGELPRSTTGKVQRHELAKLPARPGERVAYLLPRLVGLQRAKQLMLLAPEIGAAHALQLGPVNAVLPEPDAALAHALSLAGQLAAGHRPALAQAKALLNASTGGSLSDSLELEAGIQAGLLKSEPVRRGFADFLAGRDR